MRELLNIDNQEFNHIGKNSSIEGELNLTGTTFFSGKVHGQIKMSEAATLIIERDGFVDGTVECYDIEVYGKVVGRIKSQGTLTVYPCGIIAGDIITKNIIVKPGATINIECQTL